MSIRGRAKGGLVKQTVLILLVVFALLLLFRSLNNASRLQAHSNQVVKPLVVSVRPTPPQPQYLPEPVDAALLHQLEEELPEVDYDFWYRFAKPKGYQMNNTCARYPDPLELQLHNTYWQTFTNANVTFRLYAAYLDKRKGVRATNGVVRVLLTANQINNKFPDTHCQLWYAGHKAPLLVQVSEFLSIWFHGWGKTPLLSYPHILSCTVPEDLPPNLEGLTPRTVSLVSQVCESAANSLRIHYDLPPVVRPVSDVAVNATDAMANYTSIPQLNFAVCLKGFDFPYVDLSERLIEWFELQRLLGAKRIYAYLYDVHPAVQRVLDYYQRSGYLELRPLTMANGMPRLRLYQHLLLQHKRLVKRLNELIPYNDCFYRNMYRHDYLLNVDIDEVIMPMGALRTWQEVLDTDRKLSKLTCPNGFVALCVINSYFTKVVAEAHNHEQLNGDELYVLQHTMRYRNYSSPNAATKCFHSTRYALTLHNHFTLKWLKGGCSSRSLDVKLVHMQHYREPDKKYELTELLEDRTVWKYAPELRAAVEQVWMHLNDVPVETTDLNEPSELLD